MGDFSKWQTALGDAGTLRVQQQTAQRVLDAAIVERDRLFLTTRPDSPVFRDAQARVEAQSRNVESFTPRIGAAEAEAARQEPTQAEKRDQYCPAAARARAMGMSVGTQTVLDNRCRAAGGDPMAAPIMAANAQATPVPASPTSAARNLLPVAAAVVILAAVAGGAYLWSQQKAAANAPRR